MSTRRQELPEPVNLRDKFGLFSDYWSPKIVGELNDSLVKAVKLKGEFVWHHHEAEDELFLVVDGRLRINSGAGTGTSALENSLSCLEAWNIAPSP